MCGCVCTPKILLREFEPFVLKYIDESLAWPDIISASNVTDILNVRYIIHSVLLSAAVIKMHMQCVIFFIVLLAFLCVIRWNIFGI